METRIEGFKDLVKDNGTRAVLNTNDVAYRAAIKRSKNAEQQKDEINNIKEDVHELKNMMRTIIGQLENGR